MGSLCLTVAPWFAHSSQLTSSPLRTPGSKNSNEICQVEFISQPILSPAHPSINHQGQGRGVVLMGQARPHSGVKHPTPSTGMMKMLLLPEERGPGAKGAHIEDVSGSLTHAISSFQPPEVESVISLLLRRKQRHRLTFPPSLPSSTFSVLCCMGISSGGKVEPLKRVIAKKRRMTVPHL